MADAAAGRGRAELRAALRESRAPLAAVMLFSAFVNLLMLTGPVFMLQVYDRVLASRSEATLVALVALVAFLYLTLGLLDYARGRVTARVGARFQDRLDRRVFVAAMQHASVQAGEVPAQGALRDLESVQRLLSSPALLALLDVPWTPIFVFAIFAFHPWLGWLTVSGGAVLVLAAVLHRHAAREPAERVGAAVLRADRAATRITDEAETRPVAGSRGPGFERWQEARARALSGTVEMSDRNGGLAAFFRAFRLFLQSAILGLGAWLVLLGQLTPGAMIAGSILLGRALAPMDQSILQWGTVQRAQEGWARLAALLGAVPTAPAHIPLPRPRARLEVRDLAIVPPGERAPILRGISFSVTPGQAVGVIGASGAGKSSLARALIGAWQPAMGHVRLDGAAINQYAPDTVVAHIGYLPQQVKMFDGTIAEHIARLGRPETEAVVAAARMAAAHEMILALPRGYDTRIGPTGCRLSGGQMQRLGLARAFHGAPVLLVLDEPGANLDNEGSVALDRAIRETRAAGGAVVIMAHEPATIRECDMLLVLEGGAMTAFGPRDRVLRETVRNHTEILRSITTPGSVA